MGNNDVEYLNCIGTAHTSARFTEFNAVPIFVCSQNESSLNSNVVYARVCVRARACARDRYVKIRWKKAAHKTFILRRNGEKTTTKCVEDNWCADLVTC